MRFTNTPTSGGSYEKPAPGKYMGVIIGVADVGMQPSSQYDSRRKIMLRWELHKRKGPAVDSEGKPYTVTQMFGATVRGDNSQLRKCLESHGISIREGEDTDSFDWLGHTAWLELKLSKDEKYINVVSISGLDKDEDTPPVAKLPKEHWDPETDKTLCPSWCAWAVARSLNIAHLAPIKAAKEKDDDEEERRPVMAGANAASQDNDSDDIPF